LDLSFIDNDEFKIKNKIQNEEKNGEGNMKINMFLKYFLNKIYIFKIKDKMRICHYWSLFFFNFFISKQKKKCYLIVGEMLYMYKGLIARK